MIENKVVARFKDGTIMKGVTNDFFPNKGSFHLTLENGDVEQISVEQLKAIFFVKDFDGNKERRDSYNDPVPGGGQKFEVEFFDGEVMVGFSQGYSPNRQGFFVVPADRDCNNSRIYVVTSAAKKVSPLNQS